MDFHKQNDTNSQKRIHELIAENDENIIINRNQEQAIKEKDEMLEKQNEKLQEQKELIEESVLKVEVLEDQKEKLQEYQISATHWSRWASQT